MASKHTINLAKRLLDKDGKEKVTHIGGILNNGIEWVISHDEAVEGIRSGRFEYYMQLGEAVPEKLVIGKSVYGDTFIKSELDRYEPLRLLKLPSEV